MRSSAIIAGAFAPAVLAAIQAKNVIYIVPDGYGQASQTMARDLATLVDHAGDVTRELAADDMVSLLTASSYTWPHTLTIANRFGVWSAPGLPTT